MAGDIGTLVGGVRALVSHLESRSWLEALGDVQAVWKEIMAGFAVPVMAGNDGKDCCSDESVQKLCKDLEGCCDKMEDIEPGHPDIAPYHPHTPAKADPTTPVVGVLGGQLLQLLGPLLLQALQAILAGLLKPKTEAGE